MIRALNTDGSLFGYVSTLFSETGQIFATDYYYALTVSFVTTDKSGSGNQLTLIPEVDFGFPQSRVSSSSYLVSSQNLDTLNNANYPFLGFVQGRDDVNDILGPGSYQ